MLVNAYQLQKMYRQKCHISYHSTFCRIAFNNVEIIQANFVFLILKTKISSP